jgi:hypothetical protein
LLADGQANMEIRTTFGDLWVLDYSEIVINSVPVPAAAWLFGSGLVGLVGIARRKQTKE